MDEWMNGMSHYCLVSRYSIRLAFVIHNLPVACRSLKYPRPNPLRTDVPNRPTGLPECNKIVSKV